jgi:hypothetical protein
MNALFDATALAIVAYAHVDGRTGKSTGTNSGIGTTRLGNGRYAVSLSTAMAQDPSRDLIFVQPTSTGPSTALPASSVVINGGTVTKLVNFGNASSTMSDTSFAIIVFRTTITPPVGSPA